MKFTDALEVAYQIPWSYVNTFEVYFAWNYSLLNNDRPGIANTVDYNNSARGGRNILGWHPKDNERLSLHIIDVNTPSITSNELNSWVGQRWSRANGKQAQYTFSIKFRDSNQMEFYRLFATQYREQQYRYFDDYTFNVFITKDSDYGDRYHNDMTGYEKNSWRPKSLMSLKRCAIQTLSELNFSNATENQHVEFTVQFVANDIELYDAGARQFYKYAEGDLSRMDASYFNGKSGGYTGSSNSSISPTTLKRPSRVLPIRPTKPSQQVDNQQQKIEEDLSSTGVEVKREGDNIKIILPESIAFEKPKHNIKTEFHEVLDKVIDTLKEYDESTIKLNGYASEEGKKAYNLKLSKNRAQAVSAYLKDKGISSSRITATGYGETTQFGSNYEPNRGVELIITPVA